MDINSPDFAESFRVNEAVVGVVGMDLVGRAFRDYFLERKFKVLSFDPYEASFGDIECIVKEAQVIFVCTPAPMLESGRRNSVPVQDSLLKIEKTAKELGRPLGSFVVCIVSPVDPGFTDDWKRRADRSSRTVYSPEFLSQEYPDLSMKQLTKIVVGGDMDDVSVVLQFFFESNRRRTEEGKLALFACSAVSAELTRLFVHGILDAKVTFSRRMKAVCDSMKVPFEEVRILSALDPRVGGKFTTPDATEREITNDVWVLAALEDHLK